MSRKWKIITKLVEKKRNTENRITNTNKWHTFTRLKYKRRKKFLLMIFQQKWSNKNLYWFEREQHH
jgi:hypothetical protein